MFHAYRGTIDDEGETFEDSSAEVARTLDGGYGQVMWNSSFLVERGGQAVAAIIVTWWQEAPLVAFVMTHPAAKGQGLGTLLLQQSINALLQEGQRELYLFVTEGNAPAQHIYTNLGFRVVS
jgi:ribosomal protein S18 acetylase RimI-like enzyme